MPNGLIDANLRGRASDWALIAEIYYNGSGVQAREELFVRDRNQYWFPAKRRGWGWGPPTVWQGWAVLIGILVANAAAAAVLMPRHVVEFLCFVFATVLLMLLICSVKGEPPAWR